MAGTQNTTPLPPKWNEMSSAERDAIMYNLLIKNKAAIAGHQDFGDFYLCIGTYCPIGYRRRKFAQT